MTNDILCALDGGDGSCLDPSRSVFCLWCYRTPYLFIGLQESQSSRPATVSLVSHKISLRGPILFILYSAFLLSLITTHSLSNQSFCDDTLLLQYSFPDQIPLSWLCRHAIMHLWGEDLNDLKQSETETKIQSETLLVNQTGPFLFFVFVCLFVCWCCFSCCLLFVLTLSAFLHYLCSPP